MDIAHGSPWLRLVTNTRTRARGSVQCTLLGAGVVAHEYEYECDASRTAHWARKMRTCHATSMQTSRPVRQPISPCLTFYLAFLFPFLLHVFFSYFLATVCTICRKGIDFALSRHVRSCERIFRKHWMVVDGYILYVLTLQKTLIITPNN